MRLKTVQQADKMLDAAGRLFGKWRFHEVRMEDIAAEARVGKGTLYRYFQDKEELYSSLLERASDQLLGRLHAVVTETPEPLAQLEAMVEAIIIFFDERPHLHNLIQRAEVLHDEGAAFPWEETRKELQGTVLAIFAAARERGAFTVRDPELTGLLLLGGLRNVIRSGPRPRPEGLAQRIVANVLRGGVT